MTSAPPNSSIAIVEQAPAAVSRRQARIRLEHLDGVRGAASFYVMLTHLVLFINPVLLYRVAWLLPATAWMHYGRTSVSIFIVLSGYCLMLPVAGSSSSEIPGGIVPYLKRRARRIMPPYYAALAIALVLMWVFASRIAAIDTFWQTMAPATPAAIVSHLLLVHNFNNNWIFRIDAPMWSVATEWQIYFLFPLLFLPLYRKSTALMLIAASAVSVAPMLLLHRGETAAPWFALLFCFGMVGAAANFSPAAQWQRVNSGINWSAACFALTASAVVWHALLAPRLHLRWKGDLVEDVTVGLATMTLLIACTNSLKAEARSPLVRMLDSKPMMFLGAISYSLYLIHAPVLGTLDILIRTLNMPAQISAALYVFGGAVAAISITWLFHLAFERPFKSSRTG